jgi:hypothetical protein
MWQRDQRLTKYRAKEGLEKVRNHTAMVWNFVCNVNEVVLEENISKSIIVDS